jgi:tetratricopeptide (TPR) repeat protein
VLTLDADYLAAYYQLGQLYELLLRNPEAIEYYKKGLSVAKTQGNNKAVNEFNEAIFLLEDD